MDSFTIKRISSILEGYISLKIPSDLRGEVRITYQIGERMVTLSEERPDWTERLWSATEFVQFRLEEHVWAVYTKVEGNVWRPLTSITPSSHFEEVLEQVEMDTSEVIWVT